MFGARRVARRTSRRTAPGFPPQVDPADPADGADRAQAGSGGGAGLAVPADPGIHVSTSARKGTSHSSWQSTPMPADSTRWMST